MNSAQNALYSDIPLNPEWLLRILILACEIIPMYLGSIISYIQQIAGFLVTAHFDDCRDTPWNFPRMQIPRKNHQDDGGANIFR